MTPLLLRLLFLSMFCTLSFAAHVELKPNGVWVDGSQVPFLFGGEVQYFRARAGATRNIPAAHVEAHWRKLLSRVKEARMNSVIFYIPWDFHEPEEGVFDFDGTLDRDHDGNPDYPSRNLKKFFALLEEFELKNIMVRPGPYINAEWGVEGFGAIPGWFLDRFPQSLTVNQHPGRARTVSFGDPEFRTRTKRWFKTLYEQVLKDHIGPGKPITFLQIDNETNYFWDSVYERDWSEASLSRYREFLKLEYKGDLTVLNSSYGSSFTSFEAVVPPKSREDATVSGLSWHYDWFHFHDIEILDYYRFLRATWEAIGVHEPDVLFTSCDSFNASENGLLPRLDYRGDQALTLSTMNIYPKTGGTTAQSTLNNPMKGAHDATLISSAHRQFYGNGGNWLMSTETMGGWFPPTEVNLAARQHTYGSLVASGVKALMIYYLHEGWNWNGKEGTDSELHFDAPLDKDLNPRPAFEVLKSFGAAIENGLGTAVLNSSAASAEILIAHDSSAQYTLPGYQWNGEKASTDSAAFFGLLREAGYAADVAFIDRMSKDELLKYKIVFWDHVGFLPKKTEKQLKILLENGRTVITLGNTGLRKKKRQNLIVWNEHPAWGWNSDWYSTIPNINERLAMVKSVLEKFGVAQNAVLVTEDNANYLHAWTRPTGNATLLAVENFSKTVRSFKVKIPGLESEAVHATPLWNFRAPKQGRHALSDSFSIGPDSISLWLVEKD